MATFGRVQTPDKETINRLDESVSVRADLREKLKGLYKKLKELEAETKVVEGEYKALESQARTSVACFDGNTIAGILMIRPDGLACRLNDCSKGYEAFTAPIVEKGTVGATEWSPYPQAKKAGHREMVYVSKGQPLKVYFNSLNDARLWWADGAPEKSMTLNRWSV